MLKVSLNLDPKSYLKRKDLDRTHHFTLAQGQIRGAYLHGNLMIHEMKANHGLGALETLILGQAYLAGGLLATTLKNEERLNFKIDCTGPIGGLSVDSSSFGEIRGYLFSNPIVLPPGTTELALDKLWGTGTLMVTRKKGAGAPHVSSLELKYPDLATNLVDYCQNSDQVTTALDLSLRFDENGQLLGAGGLILQALPGADEATLASAFSRVKGLPSLGDNASEDHDPSALLEFWFGDLEPKLLQSRRIEFFCPCSKNQFLGYMKTLPLSDRQSIALEGPFPVVTTCHNCGTVYEFEQAELEEISK